MYDYLLVVGPGRSGSDFLYSILRAHPDYAFPEIKEGAYYRSVRAYRRGRAKVRPAGKLLCDIANDAYHDPRLVPGVRTLRQEGISILMMILLRDHCDRALSAIRFRKSRGRPSAFLGARHLERAVVRDRLTPGTLEGIFGLDIDILTVDFSTLVDDTEALLAKLASPLRHRALPGRGHRTGERIDPGEIRLALDTRLARCGGASPVAADSTAAGNKGLA